MITFLAHVRVLPENAEKFEALAQHVTDMTMKNEPGVAYYAWAKSVDVVDTYLVIEVYNDAASQAAHMKTEWVMQSLLEIGGLIEGAPEIRQYVSDGSEPVRDRLF